MTDDRKRISRVLTPQNEDYPQWYQDVCSKAELVDNGPVRGTMVIRPYGFSIWEQIRSEVDGRIKAAGAKGVYFPLLIPASYLQREAEHVEGFSPELAMVTHAGGKELEEALVIRPTSETIVGEYMAKWIQSYRDLPLMLNQWVNIVRWEMRPRLFLRNTEFLWQEGHTAHADEKSAAAYVAAILHDVQEDSLASALAIPVAKGLKTAKERFAGAVNSFSCEGMMGDGKALQMGTSHELGQNFARAFNIQFLDEDGQHKFVWTTSWGMSTRMLGGLIMVHGDDRGMVVPPVVAPIQVVVVLVKDAGDARTVARRLSDELAACGIRVELDERVETSFGRRSTDWELKGVPLRIEVGPRELAEDLVTLVRRHTLEKESIPLGSVTSIVASELEGIQRSMLERATDKRDRLTVNCESVAAAVEAAQTGWARLPWSLLGVRGEAEIAEQGVSVRCLQRFDGSVPSTLDDPNLMAIVARAY